jgi:hypothetical protein
MVEKCARTGLRLAAAGVCLLLSGAAVADCGPARLERATVERVTSDGDIVLADSRRLRLAGLHLGAFRPEDWPQSGETIAFGVLDDEKDRWSRLPALVFALPEGRPAEWLHKRLLERGAALARPESGLDGCWDLLRAEEAAVQAKLPKDQAEAGRFSRVAGRVQRVGEGRSAHFITLFDRSGTRVTGLVQKRHLKRFREGGVDVAQLRGQFIRLRGVRSATNSTVIPLTMVEQIEIVR